MFKKISSIFESKEKKVRKILKENDLPKELEDIIYDYKTDLEKSDKIIKQIIKYANKYLYDARHYTYELNENGRSEFIEKHINYIIQQNNFGFTEDEIFEIIVENVDLYISSWAIFGAGSDTYAKIEDIPRKLIRRYQNNVKWTWVGSGSEPNGEGMLYTNIEDLPIDFLEEFKDKIDWNFVGSGLLYYKKIEDLPIDFLEKFKDKINWQIIGNGFINKNTCCTKIEDLPRDFVEQFKDKIFWEHVGSGIKNKNVNYTPYNKLPKDFIEQFKDYIKINKN